MASAGSLVLPLPASARYYGDASGAQRLLVFGDSLTEGYYAYGRLFHPYAIRLADRLQTLEGGVLVAESGKSGECTDAMRVRLGELLDAFADVQLSAAVILGGTNDLAMRRHVPGICANITAMHALLRERGIRSVALTVPERAGELMEPLYLTCKRELNEFILHGLADAVPGVHVVDLDAALPYTSLSADERARLWDDGLHLKPEGYDRLGDIVYEGLHLAGVLQRRDRL